MLPPVRRRWWKRLRIFGTILLLAGLLVYLNVRGIIVWFANRGNPPLMLDLRSASLHLDRLELSGVVIKMRGTKEEVIRADSASVEFSWQSLREHRLGEVTVKKPQVRINDRLLDAARNATSGLGGRATEAWFVKSLKVIDGAGELDLANEPLVRFTFAPELHDLQLGSGAPPRAPQQTVALENIELLSRGLKPQPFGSVSRIELKFSQRGAEKLNFDELSIRSPSFQITPEALNAFASSSSQATTPITPGTASIPNFRVGKLVIENGEMFIKDFGEAIPEGSLKFGMTTDDLQFGDSGTALEKKHAFQIWDVRLAPDFAPLAPFASIDSLQIEFTPAGPSSA